MTEFPDKPEPPAPASPPAGSRSAGWRANARFAADIVNTLAVPLLTIVFTRQGFPAEHVVHMAVATATATIIFTSVASMREHQRHRAILWPVVAALAPGIIVGSLLGPQIVGGMSTALTPEHGEVIALQLAMYALAPFYAVAIFFLAVFPILVSSIQFK